MRLRHSDFVFLFSFVSINSCRVTSARIRLFFFESFFATQRWERQRTHPPRKLRHARPPSACSRSQRTDERFESAFFWFFKGLSSLLCLILAIERPRSCRAPKSHRPAIGRATRHKLELCAGACGARRTSGRLGAPGRTLHIRKSLWLVQLYQTNKSQSRLLPNSRGGIFFIYLLGCGESYITTLLSLLAWKIKFLLIFSMPFFTKSSKSSLLYTTIFFFTFMKMKEPKFFSYIRRCTCLHLRCSLVLFV